MEEANCSKYYKEKLAESEDFRMYISVRNNNTYFNCIFSIYTVHNTVFIACNLDCEVCDRFKSYGVEGWGQLAIGPAHHYYSSSSVVGDPSLCGRPCVQVMTFLKFVFFCFDMLIKVNLLLFLFSGVRSTLTVLTGSS